MATSKVGVLGASGQVGRCVLELLTEAGRQVAAYSRSASEQMVTGVEWRQLDSSVCPTPGENDDVLPCWICLSPVQVLPDYFALLESHKARRLVVLSSTSRFTKIHSHDPEERRLIQRLIRAEELVIEWAEKNDVEWVILRPTLIYGFGRDKNITEIARFIRRFGFFPVFGKAQGLRQPVHARDVARACVSALGARKATNQSYNLSGAEIVSYRDMVARVFRTMNKPARLIPVPLVVFRLAVALLRLAPRYRSWSYAMAERMNHDLVFEHSDAETALDFKPRGFLLSPEDVEA